MPFLVFKKDIDHIYSLVEFGREPVLSAEETDAVNNYAMKRSAAFTPMLRYIFNSRLQCINFQQI